MLPKILLLRTSALCWRIFLCLIVLQGWGIASPIVSPTTDESYKENYGTKFIDPVIFEPMPNITLSRSSYQVVGQLDFLPYFELFNQYESFITKFRRDVFDRPKENDSSVCDETTPEDNFENHYSSNKFCIRAALYTKSEEEVNFLYNLYLDVKNKFNLAIDNVNTIDETSPPTQEGVTTPPPILGGDPENDDPLKIRNKRSKRVSLHGYDGQSRYMDMNDQEFETITRLVQGYLAKNPKLRTHLKRRFKRFGIMSWVLGWGIFNNFKSSAQMRRNIQILQDQNILQDNQIQELTKFVHLSLVTLRRHHEILHDVQIKLEIIKIQIGLLVAAHQRVEFHLSLLSHLQTTMQRLTTGILIINEQVDKIYEYMRVIASHQLNPLILNPTQFRIILKDISEKLRSHPRLSLPRDPDENIWDYYAISRITPLVEKGYLVVILTIPLSDKSLAMSLFRVHNLPSLHPDLKVEVNYVLEGSYLALSWDKEYAAIPTEKEIHICQVTKGFLCTLNSALYPVKKIEWCLYALYTRNPESITEYCMVDTKTRNTPRAINLGGFVWAVSSLVSDKLYVRCVDNSHLVEIHAPLTLITIPSGCEGWNPSINIPAKNELSSQSQVFQTNPWFASFNKNYQNFTHYGIWQIFNIPEINKLEAELYGTVLGEFPQFKIKYLKKQFNELIDTSRVGLHPKYVIAIAITITLLIAIVVIIVMYKYGRLHNVLRAVRTNVKFLSPNEKLPMLMTAKRFRRQSKERDTEVDHVPIPPPRKYHFRPSRASSGVKSSGTGKAAGAKMKSSGATRDVNYTEAGPSTTPSSREIELQDLTTAHTELQSLDAAHILHAAQKAEEKMTRAGYDLESTQRFFAKRYQGRYKDSGPMISKPQL